MKKKRRPYPDYTYPKRSAGGLIRWHFNPPSWARKAGCPLKGERLGADFLAAKARVETVLLPAFHSWRTGGATDGPPRIGVVEFTLDWLFHEFRKTWDRGTMKRDGALSAGQRRVHETGIKLLCEYTLPG